MTLTFVMMSVVAFAQQTEQKALPSLKKQPTLKQQILQAKREGKQLNKETIAQFKYNKPAASQIIKKQQRNLNFPVKKLDAAAATAQQALRRSGEGYPKTYNFDDSSMQEWTTIDADGDGYTWVLGSQTGGIYLVDGASLAGTGHNSSEDFVTSASYSNVVGALTPDNYLVSPKVKLTGSFTFYACGQDANYAAEVFGVAVSTTGNTDAADFTMVQSWTMTAAPSLAPAPFAKANQFRSSRRAQGTWYKYVVDLSSYGGEGYVAIRHYGCSDEFLLDVDDITIDDVVSDTAPVDPRVTPPAGLVTEDWFFAGYFYDGQDEYPTEKSLQVGVDGKDVYVQGIGNYQPEAWIKGTLSDVQQACGFSDYQEAAA